MEVFPPTGTTPKKRSRIASPEKQHRSLPLIDTTTSTRAHATNANTNHSHDITELHQPKSDTHYITFTAAPFITAEEFKAILLDYYITNPHHLGWVKHGSKRGCDKSYLIAEILNYHDGDRLIAKLGRQEYCNIPLEPRWVGLSEWGYFFQLRTKLSAHNELAILATSTLVQKIKRECPQSHHHQLDELLCSTNDTSNILQTYESWFGSQAFSPFGKIEDSTL